MVDPAYFRPAEVETLIGDATKAREKLGWVPKTSFADLVEEMVQSDFRKPRLRREFITGNIIEMTGGPVVP